MCPRILNKIINNLMITLIVTICTTTSCTFARLAIINRLLKHVYKLGCIKHITFSSFESVLAL